MEIQGTIMDTIETETLLWYGHMQGQRLAQELWEWIPTERKRIGRPRNRWLNEVRKAMEIRHLGDEWIERTKWRHTCS